MPFTYKTIYIPTPETKPKSMFSAQIPELNGDQLARDVQATLIEQEAEGYYLYSITPVQSGRLYMSSMVYSHTDGVLMVFRKGEATH